MINYYCVILLTIFFFYFYDFQIYKSICKLYMYWYIILIVNKFFKIFVDSICVVFYFFDVEDFIVQVVVYFDYSFYIGIYI